MKAAIKNLTLSFTLVGLIQTNPSFAHGLYGAKVPSPNRKVDLEVPKGKKGTSNSSIHNRYLREANVWTNRSV
jgi:hypothetical protein